MSRKKRLFFKLLTCALCLGTLFISGEIFVRLDPRLYCNGYRPSGNKKLVYELYPGYTIHSLRSTISSQGMHDRFFALKKPEGVRRIAVVSDSFLFGWKIGMANSAPKVLERLLNSRGKIHYEVINFSVPGYNTAQEYELIREKVLKFEPDMVILAYCGNDIFMCNYFSPEITLTNLLYNKSFLVHYLLRRIDLKLGDPEQKPHPFLRKRWLSFKKHTLGMFYYHQLIYPYPGLEETDYIEDNPPSTIDKAPEPYWYMLGENNYRIHLSNINSLLLQHQVKLICCGFYDDNILRIHQDLHIDTLSYHQCFQADSLNASNFELPADGHHNVQGHRLFAGYLYRFMKSQKLLEQE